MFGSNSTILLVDDDEGFRYAASKTLENAGFAVVAALDYREALEVLEGDTPVDLMVTDIYFPKGIHGFALARMARMRRLGLKVIYVTGFDVPEVEDVGKVLRKPISGKQFLSEVEGALAS
jgi:CheY-like chemotaxis protein